MRKFGSIVLMDILCWMGYKSIYLFCLFFFNTSFSQNTQTITYTVKEGLPSNTLYRTIIDKKGYLWIATEIGMSRFDGKKFRNYNTSDGLTDNEITNLFVDSSGGVWAIPFRRTPCYYNATKDRFENEETNPELGKIILVNPSNPHILKYGGVAFSTTNRKFFLYKNNHTSELLINAYNTFSVPSAIIEYQPNKLLLFAEDSIRQFSDGQLSAILGVNRKLIMSESLEEKVYLASGNSILVYQFNDQGKVSFITEKKYPFNIRIFCKTGKRFAITSLNGNTYLLDKNTLEIAEIISVADGTPTRNVLEDKDDNIWLSTIDKGMIKIQKKRISSIDNKSLQQNFNALIKTKNIFVGNNNGEVYSYDGLYAKKLAFSNDKNIDTWVRNIIATKYGIYVATQSGSFLINEKTLQIESSFKGMESRSTKAVAVVNDSILLLGGHAFAFTYNIKTKKVVDSIAKRVVSLGSDLSGNIYIGSNEGLYLWKDKKLMALAEQRKGFSYKISALACSPDNLMWVGLGSDSLMLMKNNQWIASIPLGDIIPGNICKSLCCVKSGELWLGTNKGLNRIYYSYKKGVFTYTNTYFGTSDGLIGEQINDIAIQDSTVYVATNAGISYLPVNIQLPISDIPSFVSSVSINSKPAELKELYTLNYDENNITIVFSGVDLTGFIPLFEYNVNNGKWERTEKIELKKLPPGIYTIKIRAIRRDGKPSNNVASLEFEIKPAFWQSSWFWILLVGALLAAVLYLQQSRNKQKQKIVLEKVLTEKRMTELEMQALKAQINPHFVFNCLNSIKGFIYDKDYAQADKYLDKFSELMRSTIDNSDASIISLKDEIIYLDNYLLLEKLRFEDQFEYLLQIDPSLDKVNVFVPAMLLQPYVENAIRHGIRFLENKKGLIQIKAEQETGYLVCSIDDNGIGREKASQLKSRQHIEYQSKGMHISKRRAELYHIKQEVIDKKDIEGNSLGTTIIVKIPLALKP